MPAPEANDTTEAQQSAEQDAAALVAAGELATAAAVYERQGQHDEALRLYEKLWDFASAARLAGAMGDLPRALTNTLRGRDPAALDELLEQARTAEAPIRERCAAICEERNLLAVAGELLEGLGRTSEAAQLYRRAGERLEAGRLHEAAGEHRLALELYREHLAEVEEGPPAAAAELALGRLLLRYGRPERAVERLQAAARHDPERAQEAIEASAVALQRCGYAHAASVTLRLYEEHGDRAPRPLKDCLDDPRFARLERDEEDHTVLAGRYRLGELLGSGGMGRVYAARDLLDDKKVAVKVFTAPGGARGRDAYKRFVREALTTGRLDHPHIVRLLDFNEEMGFIVLEHMDGGTLADRLRPRLGVAACRGIALQLLDGLAAAQQRGIVHRDLKPSNIFFSAVGAAKLGDFGVAHLSDAGQTQTGAFIGTLAYMSPEQIVGAKVNFATDIYALGVVLHQMLTGYLPFEPPDLVDKHLHSEPPRPSARIDDLPSICDQIVLRCLAKKPEERYESLAALRADVLSLPTRGDAITATKTGEERPSRAGSGDQRSSSRFTVEALRHVDEGLELAEARDDELGRSVLLARITAAEGEASGRDDLARLLAAAASADAHLSSVLSLDPATGEAVLELPMGEPLELPVDDPFDLCEQLASALAPLHAQGVAHGALRHSTCGRQGDYVQLSLIEALLCRSGATSTPSISDDLAQLGSLCGLQLPPLQNAAELLRWLRDEREARARASRREHLAEALADAPPEVDREL